MVNFSLLAGAGLLAVAVGAVACQPTQAATVVETFTLPVGTQLGDSEVPIPLFDPALGTLTSLAVNISGMLTDAGMNAAVLASSHGGATFSNSTGTARAFGPSRPFVINFTDIADIPFFVGPGSTTIGDRFFPDNADARVTFAPLSTLTYNYTPVATPEPASLALLMAGVAGLSVLRWRSRPG